MILVWSRGIWQSLDREDGKEYHGVGSRAHCPLGLEDTQPFSCRGRTGR